MGGYTRFALLRIGFLRRALDCQEGRAHGHPESRHATVFDRDDGAWAPVFADPNCFFRADPWILGATMRAGGGAFLSSHCLTPRDDTCRHYVA